MTYTYNDQAIFEAVPGAKAIIRRPIGMSDKKWAKYADGVVKALDNRAPCTPLERGEAIHKAANLMMVEAVNACLAESTPSMKLVDILARELKAWPEKSVAAVQQSSTDDRVSFVDCMDVKFSMGQWDYSDPCMRIHEQKESHEFERADDWKTAIVTRAEWQAAVDALKVAEGIADAEAGNLSSLDEVKGKWKIRRNPLTLSTMIDMAYDFSAWPPERFDCGLLPSVYLQSFGRGKRHQPVEVKSQPGQWDGEGLPPVGIDCEVHDCQHEYTKQFNGQTVRIVAHHLNLRGNSVAVFEAGDCVYHGLVSEKFRPVRTAEQVAAEKREKEISAIAAATGLRAGGGRIEVAIALYDAGYRKPVNTGK